MTCRNRALVRPGAALFRALYDECRGDLAALSFKHACALADLHRELDACRAELEELRAAVLARQNAETELRELYRERAIQRARAAERDPAAPLN